MAKWTEAERVQIRRWLGFPAIYTQAEPRLETALDAVLAIGADGGTRPDNSTQVAIQGWLTQLAAIETQWLTYLKQMQASEVAKGAVKIDALRGLAGLKQIGRMYVGHMADALGLTKIPRDVFTAPDVGGGSHDLTWR